MHQLPVQMKVYSVCYYWVEHYYADDFAHDSALAQVRCFYSSVTVSRA